MISGVAVSSSGTFRVSETLLRCEALSIGYKSPLLPPVNLEVRPGEFWVVLGRNGSGKTTFFKTLLGLIPAVDGVVFQATDLRIAYLAQRMSFDDLYPVQVNGIVASGTFRGLSFLRPGHDKKAVQKALEAVGIGDLARRTFRSLSGGQKQRVLFARMLASGAPLALLDEPTAGMDAVAESEVMALLDLLRQEYGLTVIVVTHYLQVARDHAEHILFLDPDEQEVLVGTADKVFGHPAFVARYGKVLGQEDGGNG
ncbi:MAG: metal ABC transporter ATP-binding protein [Proteobacteria bacterium]|jgi:zinc transport system ATP-binding protein|nr:metal ABC transporter ATP-binding protein [Pseudomonadota bacterium]